MKGVSKGLFVGTESDCKNSTSGEWAVVHACKAPCHTNALGYRGSLRDTDPNYLFFEKGNHLYLNLVDMDREFLPKFANPIMKAAMVFIERHLADKSVLIHCNLGLSRSPSIAMIYLARMGVICSASLQEAIAEFRLLYPLINPGKGISLYMERNWSELISSNLQ